MTEREQLVDQLIHLEQQIAAVKEKLGMQSDRVLASHSTHLDKTAFELLTEYASDFLSVHDNQGLFLFASASCERLFGWKAYALLDKSAFDFFHIDDLQQLVDQAGALQISHFQEPVIYRFRCADDSYRWVETSTQAYFSVAGSPRTVCVTRDVDELHHALEKLREANRKLESISTSDSLTGLYNRRKLDERLQQLVREARRGRKFVLALVDLDHFKAINDEHGHQAGDELLVAVATTLVSTCRDIDFVARYGGEEFVIIYVDVDVTMARTMAERQRKAIACMELPSGQATASFGLADCGAEGTPGINLIARADQALYAAKQAGRNRVQTYNHLSVSDF